MMNHVALPASEIKGFKGEMRCQEQFKTIAVAEKNARKKKNPQQTEWQRKRAV